MLHIRPERNRRHVALSFVEAVSQDRAISVEELRPAYRVAGDAFLGRLKRLFIVLDDDEASQKPASAGSQKKNKRQASGDSTNGAKNKKPSRQ
jgi:hypothetical protein